jgi:hypothetical protein
MIFLMTYWFGLTVRLLSGLEIAELLTCFGFGGGFVTMEMVR